MHTSSPGEAKREETRGDRHASIATQPLSDDNKGGKSVVRDCMDKAWRVAAEAKPIAG